MDFLLQLFTEQWVVVTVISGAVFALTFALMLLYDNYFDPVRSRFRDDNTRDANTLYNTSSVSEQLRKHDKFFLPTNKAFLQRTIMRLHYGGFHGRNALLYFFAIRFVLIIGLPVLVLLFSLLIHSIPGNTLFQLMFGAVALGYVAPGFTLDKIIAIRQKHLRRSFPDALDLLVICSEAGMSLDAAIQKVADEIGISQPILAEELNVVIAETRAGIERHQALQRLVDRTGVEDIRGLVAAISQSMRFGTSIVDTLKEYSEDLRDKRIQAAEELAAKLGVKLIFPLALFLLPAFLMTLLLPTAMTFSKL